MLCSGARRVSCRTYIKAAPLLPQRRGRRSVTLSGAQNDQMMSPMKRPDRSTDPPEPDADEEELRALARALRIEIASLRTDISALQEELEATRAAEDPDRLIDLDEAAELLGISRRSLATLVHDGEIRSLKIGRRRLIPRRALDAYIRRKAEEARRDG